MTKYCLLKYGRLLTALVLLTLLLAGKATLADIPRTIAHQGRVWDSASMLPLEGLQDVTFILYQENVPQWTETLTVSFSDGYYSVVLGQELPIPEAVFSSTSISLGITIGDDAELTPRMEISSVPFAFHAGVSDNVTGNITPATISVGGQLIVDEHGNWMGDSSGLEGPAGPQGPEGPAGIAGPAGTMGPAGPMGPIGPAGADGLDGANGLQGPQGDPGPQGPAGQKGANWQGIWQTGVSYAIDDVVAYNGSSFICIQATTGLEDPENLLYWSLLAERGNDGADGVVGPQGPQGDIGPQGPAGPQGPQGDIGPQGPAGPPGAPGPQGSQGDVGPQGPAGADGAVGPQGPQGYTGPQGPAGPGGLFVTDGNGTNIGTFVESGMSGSFSSPRQSTFWLLSDQGYLFSIEVITGKLWDDQVALDYVSSNCSGQRYFRDGSGITPPTSMSFSIGLVLNSAAGVVYSPKGTALVSYIPKSTLTTGGCSSVNGNKTETGYEVSLNIPATTGVLDTTLYTTPIGLGKN